MASYQVKTTKAQEDALTWMYDNYVDKDQYQNKGDFVQAQFDNAVFPSMEATLLRDKSTALTTSTLTIPEANRDAANAEIQAVIKKHGGTIHPAGNPNGPPKAMPPPNTLIESFPPLPAAVRDHV